MDNLSEKLYVIFQNVNDWLKFAEAKNAALLAFSGTAMTAALAVVATIQNLPNSLRVSLLIATSLLCACAFLCTFSFLPKTNLERILWARSKSFRAAKPQSDDNMYYFGHLQKYDIETLLNFINQSYFDDSILLPYKKEARDLATQIIVNSSITFRKYKLFTYSSYCLAISILIVPVSMVCSLILFRSL
jgi:hypothetical protein